MEKIKDATKIFLHDGLIAVLAPDGGRNEEEYQKTPQAFLTQAQIRQHEKFISAKNKYADFVKERSYGYVNAFLGTFYGGLSSTQFTIAMELPMLNWIAGEEVMNISDAYTIEENTMLIKASGLAGLFGKKRAITQYRTVLNPAFEKFINDVTEKLALIDFKLYTVEIGELEDSNAGIPYAINYFNQKNRTRAFCRTIDANAELSYKPMVLNKSKDYVLRISAKYSGTANSPKVYELICEAIENGTF